MNGQPAALYTYRGDKEAGPWQDDRCGTYAGWNAHRHCGEPPCDDCRRAQADYVRDWRLRTGRVKTRRVRLTEAELALLRGVR